MTRSIAPRVVAGTLCQYYYTAGFLLMALVAYLLNSDWQLLQVILHCTLHSALCTLHPPLCTLHSEFCTLRSVHSTLELPCSELCMGSTLHGSNNPMHPTPSLMWNSFNLVGITAIELSVESKVLLSPGTVVPLQPSQRGSSVLSTPHYSLRS